MSWRAPCMFESCTVRTMARWAMHRGVVWREREESSCAVRSPFFIVTDHLQGTKPSRFHPMGSQLSENSLCCLLANLILFFIHLADYCICSDGTVLSIHGVRIAGKQTLTKHETNRNSSANLSLLRMHDMVITITKSSLSQLLLQLRFCFTPGN
jgi:hypothetical protein